MSQHPYTSFRHFAYVHDEEGSQPTVDEWVQVVNYIRKHQAQVEGDGAEFLTSVLEYIESHAKGAHEDNLTEENLERGRVEDWSLQQALAASKNLKGMKDLSSLREEKKARQDEGSWDPRTDKRLSADDLAYLLSLFGVLPTEEDFEEEEEDSGDVEVEEDDE
jgi:hypothetical protein